MPSPEVLRRMRDGVELDDGMTAPARVTLAQVQDGRAALEIVVHEGRNRLVRRLCEAVGHPVRRLVRTRIGPLVDRRLGPGEWRPLTQHEVFELSRAAGTPPGNDDGDGD